MLYISSQPARLCNRGSTVPCIKETFFMNIKESSNIYYIKRTRRVSTCLSFAEKSKKDGMSQSSKGSDVGISELIDKFGLLLFVEEY